MFKVDTKSKQRNCFKVFNPLRYHRKFCDCLLQYVGHFCVPHRFFCQLLEVLTQVVPTGLQATSVYHHWYARTLCRPPLCTTALFLLYISVLLLRLPGLCWTLSAVYSTTFPTRYKIFICNMSRDKRDILWVCRAVKPVLCKPDFIVVFMFCARLLVEVFQRKTVQCFSL